jgi:transcriptional regulator with XRE-family HTH domain
MKNNLFKDFHIGKIIKEIALRKGVSSKAIAAVINYSQQNADKVFRMNDMNIEDVIRISYLLEHNILFFVMNKFLPQLSGVENLIEEGDYILQTDVKSRSVSINEIATDCDFLKNIHIGNHIREYAKENNWSGRDLAKHLNCTPSMVNYIYKQKSLKIKKILQISEILQYNMVSAIYLPQIMIANATFFFENFLIVVNREKLRIIYSNDNSILLTYQLK